MGRIMIVDPSIIDRKRVRNILEAAGHTVVETASPAEAMRELQGALPGSLKLVLTELQFPEGAGIDLIHWVRDQESLQWVPILVIAAQPPRETVIDLIMAGAATIVTKPFGADMLLRRVTATLEEHAAIRQGEGNSLSWGIADFIKRELKRSERAGESYSVVICRVMDLMSGRAAPALMAELTHTLRESDTIARLGEDEIVLLLPDADAMGAWTVEDRIWKAVREIASDRENRPPLHLNVRTGAATFPSEAADVDALIALARERADRRTIA